MAASPAQGPAGARGTSVRSPPGAGPVRERRREVSPGSSLPVKAPGPRGASLATGALSGG